ncbi:type II secretion system protein [Clostridia bacterium]|nr:type II secretion system protein [Clostridia bacterium]
MKTHKRFESIRHGGFTMIELIVVITILGILMAVVVPSYLQYTEKAKEDVLRINTLNTKRIVRLYSVSIEKNKWHGKYDDYCLDCNTNRNDTSTLNNLIEKEWEKINSNPQAGEDTNSNKVNITNPYSGKRSVLDYDYTLSSGEGFCPAIFMTDNANYAYEGSGNTKNLLGTIVIYFDTETSDGTTDHIEFYYVKKDKTKSELLGTLE